MPLIKPLIMPDCPCRRRTRELRVGRCSAVLPVGSSGRAGLASARSTDTPCDVRLRARCPSLSYSARYGAIVIHDRRARRVPAPGPARATYATRDAIARYFTLPYEFTYAVPGTVSLATLSLRILLEDLIHT